MAEPLPATRFNPWPATIFIVLCVLAVLFLLPTVGVLLSSIKTTREISMGELWSLPSSVFLGNFTEVLGNPAVHQYFLNTLLVTLPATALSITLGALAAYTGGAGILKGVLRVALWGSLAMATTAGVGMLFGVSV